MGLVLSHPSGTKNFEMAPRFFEKFVNPCLYVTFLLQMLPEFWEDFVPLCLSLTRLHTHTYTFIVRTSRTHAERGHVKFNQDNLAYEQGYLACNYHCGNLFWKAVWARNILTRIKYVILVL
jgi:hypothetical protein